MTDIHNRFGNLVPWWKARSGERVRNVVGLSGPYIEVIHYVEER